MKDLIILKSLHPPPLIDFILAGGGGYWLKGIENPLSLNSYPNQNRFDYYRVQIYNYYKKKIMGNDFPIINYSAISLLNF